MQYGFRRRNRRRVFELVVLAAFVPWSMACRGTIGAAGSDNSEARGGGNSHGNGDGNSPDVGGIVGLPSGDAGALVCGDAIVPAVTDATTRHLNDREYTNTISALLGTTVDTGQLPPNLTDVTFDTEDRTFVTQQMAQGYFDIAKSAATTLLASDSQRAALFGCDPTGTTEDSCLTSFITAFGLKAYRRPIRSDEIQGLLTLAHGAMETDAYAGARLVLEAMLQAADLLYRPEFGVPDATHPGLNRLTGYELATRLAYMIWGTSPDSTLLSAAAAGQLDAVTGVSTTVTTMLADTRAYPGLAAFYSQWLRLQNGTTFAPLPSLYPMWIPATITDFQNETSQVAHDLIFRSGANFLDLVNASYSFLDASLATFYGVTLPAGATGWTRVQFADGDQRGGLLRQGSFLAFTSHAGSQSPTRRGRYIQEVLLCNALPNPPPNVNTTLPPLMQGQTFRDQLEEHLTNPTCSACHALMDPIGFGLLNYDTVGQYSAADDNGIPYDVTGTVNGIADGGAFNGPAQLELMIHDSVEFPNCVSLQLFQYSMGRSGTSADACAVQSVRNIFQAAGYSFPALVAALAQSDAFRFLPPQGGH